MKGIWLVLLLVAMAAAVDWQLEQPKDEPQESFDIGHVEYDDDDDDDDDDDNGSGGGSNSMNCRFKFLRCYSEANDFKAKRRCYLNYNKCIRDSSRAKRQPQFENVYANDEEDGNGGDAWMKCRFDFLKCYSTASEWAEKRQCYLEYNKCMRVAPKPTRPPHNGECRDAYRACMKEAGYNPDKKKECRIQYKDCMKTPEPTSEPGL